MRHHLWIVSACILGLAWCGHGVRIAFLEVNASRKQQVLSDEELTSLWDGLDVSDDIGNADVMINLAGTRSGGKKTDMDSWHV